MGYNNMNMELEIMSKKIYEAPIVTKVKLEVKNAVLSVCHTTFDNTPRVEGIPAGQCSLDPACRY